MTILINNDTTNNITYFNYFDTASNGQISTNIDHLLTACKMRWGETKAVKSSSTLYCIPLSPNETISDAASTSKYRFKTFSFETQSGGSGVFSTLNSTNGTLQTLIANSSSYSLQATSYNYAIITNNSLILSGFAANGSNLDTSIWKFVFIGWLEDSVFEDGSSPRGLACMVINSNGSNYSYRPSVENSTVRQNLLMTEGAQYSITCLSDTGDGTTPATDLWATDLWLRDDPSGYAVGRIPHVLLCKSTTLSLGQLVKIDTVIEGITDQKVWLVAANYGSDKLLMRVWTEGIL